ncbi:Rieske 2Fe-2S domain-containing protein [Gordonia rubripertincta]|uniref:cholesterol 7-desaturase n=2 Tax=Gordonia rubripertincta TaxID=36822 RepID=A0AAW6RC56_GORRU|nr:Rieske 2Fe-2S domain-containing protein [Gordonia rubripertincta]MDG6782111.1 Rieske 2Fe-2S domain-containing protein [Gordonia rubripertincta]NKY64672.1 Rieske (2Fe-2S) protein [Gordonia rubripertincta]GAB86580.1 3-ketosteroid 9alpha-hydroxylase component KshA [Gordonia rubripertincta NBRC 101908]
MELHGLSLDITGWFQVAWSGDIGPEHVVPLRYFGRDLVAYRGRDGVVRVNDRHCRHLGGSLAHGGKVVDDGIQCPFHGWVWNVDGENASIPYQDRPSRARRLGTWPVIERNESIYVWNDHAGREPFFDVPDVFSLADHTKGMDFHPAWPAGRAHYPNLRAHPQMVTENAVDPQHFRFVHSTPVAPVVLEERVQGPTWWARVGFGSGWIKHPNDADGNLRDDSHNTLVLYWAGMGSSTNIEQTAAGVRIITINPTPVEDGKTELFATYWIERKDNDIEDGSYRRRLDEAQRALPDDINIWDNQIFLDPPTLAGVEGRGFRRMRRWAKQFYPPSQVSNHPTGTADTRAPGAEMTAAGSEA